MPAAELHEMLGAYAVGSLDDLERARVERWLASSPAARAELAKLTEAAAAIGSSSPAEPPDAVWDRIEAGIRHPTQSSQGRPGPRTGGFRWTLTVAAAAVAVVVGAAAVIQTMRIGELTDTVAAKDRELDGMATELATREVQLGALNDTITVSDQRAQALDAALAERDALIASLQTDLADPLQIAADRAAADPGALQVSLAAPEAGAPQLTVVLQQDGRGYITNSSLAPLPPDLTYQLWAVFEDGRVVSVAVLGNEPGPATFVVDPDAVTAFAVTEEVDGGVAVSSNDAVAVGTVDA